MAGGTQQAEQAQGKIPAKCSAPAPAGKIPKPQEDFARAKSHHI
jgi:hypothetical protein